MMTVVLALFMTRLRRLSVFRALEKTTDDGWECDSFAMLGGSEDFVVDAGTNNVYVSSMDFACVMRNAGNFSACEQGGIYHVSLAGGYKV